MDTQLQELPLSRRERVMQEANRRRAEAMQSSANGRSREHPPGPSGQPDQGAGDHRPTPERGQRLWASTAPELFVRIVPAIDLRSWYAAIPYHHLSLAGDHGMPCRTHLKAACHLCEQVEAWSLSPNPLDQARAWLMRRTHRCLLQIVDLKALDRGVQVWCASEGVLERLLAYRRDPEYGDFTDPERGRDLWMVRRWGEAGRGYAAPQLSPHRSRIAYADWYKELRDLESFDEVPTYEAQVQRVQAMLSACKGERQQRNENLR